MPSRNSLLVIKVLEKKVFRRVLNRGRHWDPNPMGLGLRLGSIFQNFGIGIEFENFCHWNWDSFFLKLGLGLFCRPLVLNDSYSARGRVKMTLCARVFTSGRHALFRARIFSKSFPTFKK